LYKTVGGFAMSDKDWARRARCGHPFIMCDGRALLFMIRRPSS
jgi:hypothetical protein